QKIKSRLQDGSLALVIGDSLPMQVELMKQGLSDGQVGQKPYDMGYDVMGAFYAMKQGKPAPKDPTYTGLTDCTPKNADTCLGGSNCAAALTSWRGAVSASIATTFAGKPGL